MQRMGRRESKRVASSSYPKAPHDACDGLSSAPAKVASGSRRSTSTSNKTLSRGPCIAVLGII
ncbi:hypothetical protein CpipJ_CPIJ000936 [Culex quinquefasciatus]|uniref:Uncharacterized protein n=1 Tax=Culex quinquefasciatus TaxID=7176 RepID=B0W1M2_CULQU|nr:hypothetical protein CpipJ_CPIJ000936 [Culex quinquefasciatus]|eukprot:XP_001842606.1 hypothetical protein CpipJ_CPIJ000936 [Culex quinquefasciatus]